MTTEEELTNVVGQLQELGKEVDKLEKELAPKKKQFMCLWRQRELLNQKLFIEQGKMKKIKMGEPGKKEGVFDLKKMTAEQASEILALLGRGI